MCCSARMGWPVNTRVGRIKKNDPSLIEPMALGAVMAMSRFPKRILSVCVFLAVAPTVPHPAFAWGDEDHRIIALIGEHYLDPAARAKVGMLLATDTDTLTTHDIASEATWADRYRVTHPIRPKKTGTRTTVAGVERGR